MDDHDFSYLIRRALTVEHAHVLADRLGVSCPTVLRWAKCTNLPYQALRLAVKAAIDEIYGVS